MQSKTQVSLVAVAVVVFVAVLIVARFSGVSEASGVAIEYFTAEETDGKLTSTIPEAVASSLGTIANLLIAGIVTGLAWVTKIVEQLAAWLGDVLAKPKRVSNTVKEATPKPTNAVDDETWDKCEALLSDAIYRGDKMLTIILCERMNGKAYLTQGEKARA